jgi:HEAT repeat protein
VEALQTLVLSGDPTMFDVMRAALQDADPSVREVALQLAAEEQLSEFQPLVLRSLSHRDVNVRIAASWSAGQMGGPGAAEALSRMLADPDAGVRAAAVQGLAATGAPGTASMIAGALNDRDGSVVREAAQALGALRQSSSLFALLEAATSPNEQTAVAAIRALDSLRDPRALNALLELALDTRPTVAVAAIEALGALDDPAADSVLLQQCHRPMLEAQPAAALAALVGTTRPVVLAGVLPMLSDPTAEWQVRDIFSAAGEAAWPLLRGEWSGVVQQEELDRALLSLWLQTGDPVSMQTLVELRSAGMTDDDYLVALGWARTQDALCLALDLPERIAEQAPNLIPIALRQGAVECLEQAVAVLGPPSDGQIAEALSEGELPWSPWMEALVVERIQRPGELAQQYLPEVLDWIPDDSVSWYDLLLSDDPNLAREAAFVVSDQGAHLWTPERVRVVLSRRSAAPWLLHSLQSAPPGDVCAALADASLWPTSELRLERVELAGGCPEAVRGAILRQELPNADLWTLRAIHLRDSQLTTDVETRDPWILARRQDADPWATLLDNEASVDARVHAATMIPGEELGARVLQWMDLPSPLVRAALWASAGTSVLEHVASADLQVRAQSAATPAEQAVLWTLLIAGGAASPLEAGGAPNLDPMVRRALTADSLTAGEPLTVSVTLGDGRPARNAPLLVLFADGSVELHRSDRQGRWRTERPVHLLFHTWSSP